MDTIPMNAPTTMWRDIQPGEGASFPNGTLVVRIEPKCELADGLRHDESTRMGVVVRTDDGNCVPGALIVIGDDTSCEKVVWYGPRTGST